jgi:hypothetical protein
MIVMRTFRLQRLVDGTRQVSTLFREGYGLQLEDAYPSLADTATSFATFACGCVDIGGNAIMWGQEWQNAVDLDAVTKFPTETDRDTLSYTSRTDDQPSAWIGRPRCIVPLKARKQKALVFSWA